MDKYGRVLGTIYLKEGDEKSINQLLIDKGYAYAYFGKTKKKFKDQKKNWIIILVY